MAIQDALTQALAGIRQARPMLVQNVQPSPLMLEALRSGAQGDGNIETPLEGFGNLAQLLAANVTERRGRKSAEDTYGKARDALTYALTGTQPGGAPAVAAAVGGTPSANGQQVYAPAPAAPADVDGIITSTAEKYGIKPNDFRKLAQVESNFNPKAVSPTGAKGLTQFTSGTWKQYGNGGDPFDAAANTDAAARLWTDNANGLRQGLGREPTAGEVYLAHQQGLGGALALLKNPSAPVGSVVNPKHVTVNGGNLNMTAGEFANKWTSKFDNGAGVTPPDGFGARFSGTGGGILQQPDFSRAGIDPNLWNPIPQAPAFGAQPRGVKAQPGDSTATAQMMPQAGPAPAPAAPADAAPPGAIPTPGGPVPDLANAPPGAFWDRTTNSWYVPPNAQPNDPARMDRETALQVLMDARNNQWNTEGQNRLYDAAIEKLLTPPPSPEYDFHFGTDGSVYRTSNTGDIEQLQGARPPEMYRPLTDPAERAAYGIPAEDKAPYQIGPDGKVSAVGGGGITINNGPNGIDYGDPPKDMAWKRNPDGSVATQDGAPIAVPIVNGPAWQDREEAAAAGQVSAENEAGKADMMLDAVGNIREVFNTANTPVTGTLSIPFAMYSGSPAGMVRSYVKALQSGVALQTLLKLKEASSTGATGFGALSERELDIIINSIGALDPDTTDPSIFLDTLDRIERSYNAVREQVRRTVPPERLREMGLEDLLSGVPGASPAAPADANGAGEPPQSYIDEGGDPALWQYLTPEQRALWQ